jgi:hypothetical protein
VVRELVSAAGTINAIKVEISVHEASLSIVSGMTATTWAWRNGKIAVVDSDTQYVGQKIFDPRDFDVSDIAGMFSTAAKLAKSDSGQQLQIVEYADRTVYMTVTTNPESLTVFFRQDGSLVSQVDLTTLSGIGEAYNDVVSSKRYVNALGILPNQGGMYVDVAVLDTIVRTVRQPRLPVRTTTRRETTTLAPFDPCSGQTHDHRIVAGQDLRQGEPAVSPSRLEPRGRLEGQHGGAPHVLHGQRRPDGHDARRRRRHAALTVGTTRRRSSRPGARAVQMPTRRPSGCSTAPSP